MRKFCEGCVHLAVAPDGFGGGIYLCCHFEKILGHSISMEDRGPIRLKENCWEADSLHQPVRS